MATDVSAPLPDVDTPPQYIVTVTTGAALAVITRLNVYAISPTKQPEETLPPVPVMLAYAPSDLPG